MIKINQSKIKINSKQLDYLCLEINQQEITCFQINKMFNNLIIIILQILKIVEDYFLLIIIQHLVVVAYLQVYSINDFDLVYIKFYHIEIYQKE